MKPLHVPVILLGTVLAQALSAQTSDWARVTMGVSVGSRAGTTLWDVTDQPILSSNPVPPGNGAHYPADLYHVHREVGIGLTISAQATFFSSPKFGVTFELTYLGLNMTDICTVTHDGGDAELARACAFVGSSEKFGQGIDPLLGYHDGSGVDHSATAMLMQGGVIVRPFKPATLQPFFKAMAGVASTPHSTLLTESIYGVDSLATYAPLRLTIYQDYTPPPIRPVMTLGAGLTTDPSSGLQLHVEIREAIMPMSVVTGPTVSQYLQPPSSSTITGFFSVLAGFEIVLKRDRGKRY